MMKPEIHYHVWLVAFSETWFSGTVFSDAHGGHLQLLYCSENEFLAAQPRTSEWFVHYPLNLHISNLQTFMALEPLIIFLWQGTTIHSHWFIGFIERIVT